MFCGFGKTFVVLAGFVGIICQVGGLTIDPKGFHQGFMDDAVNLAWPAPVERMSGGDEEAVRPVIYVVDETTAGGTSAELGIGAATHFIFCLNIFLAVAESISGIAPSIVAPTQRIGSGKILKQQDIICHIRECIFSSVGQDDEFGFHRESV